jgi:hypothetical protein
MWVHFVHLLSQSWSSFIAALGSSTLGFLSPFLVAISSVVIFGAVAYRRSGWAALMDHFKQTMGIAAAVALGAEIIIYAPIFFWNVTKTVYLDHAGLVAAKKMLLPYDFAPRHPISPHIRILKTEAIERDPKTDTPFFVNVAFTVDDNIQLVDVTHNQGLVAPTVQLSASELNLNFHVLEGALKAASGASTEIVPRQETYISVFSTTLIHDSQIKEVPLGHSFIYVLAVWKYRLQDSSTVYIKEFCGFYTDTFTNIKYCSGFHNGTFIYRGTEH